MHINDEDDTWLNMYGKYNPFADTFRIEYEISRSSGSKYFDYEPTSAETKLIKDCTENGYLKDSGIRISAPMTRCGAEFQSMIDYCKTRSISKILVDSLKDIGGSPDEADRMIGASCAHGFGVEVADCRQVFTTGEEENEG